MKNFKLSPPGSRHKRASQQRHEPQHKRPDTNELIRLLLTIWLLVAFVAVLTIYLITRDTTVVLLWTSCMGIITIVFAYFFNKR